MNNNQRGNNNRRRGRGNNTGNRPGNGGGGGQQLNRIDSRARGNAPQLLEKYRKLAQDAHLNGDRVQAEYYLQFADHYFRVSADTRIRQEEQRIRRDDGWKDDGSESGGDEGEFSSMDADFPSFDQPAPYQSSQPQQPQQPRPVRQAQDAPPREDRPREASPREDRPRRAERPQRYEPEPRGEAAQAPETAETGAEDVSANPYEPPENPFVRGDRGTRGLRPRRDRPRDDSPHDDRPRDDGARDEGADDAPAGLDPASLPPAITRSDDVAVADEVVKPRRGRPRKPRPDDETLETVG